jgi:uncharacterized protein
MNEVFADSFYFLARLNPADQWHDLAISCRLPSDSQLVTTTWVFVEVSDALSGQKTRKIAGEFVRQVLAADSIEVVPADEESFVRGLALYLDRPDKEWSLTDCISFILMQDRGITDALTGDHHFEQAGFNVLLKI